MKRSPLIALVVSAAIAAAALSTAGCSTTTPGTPTRASHSATHPVTYAPQVVLPFGKFVNHLAGVTVDSAGNVFVSDSGNNRLLRLAPGNPGPTSTTGC